MIQVKAKEEQDNVEDLRMIGVDLICVIDRSGSMTDKNKIETAKTTLIYLINQLNNLDKLAIIEFNNLPNTIFQLTQMDEIGK